MTRQAILVLATSVLVTACASQTQLGAGGSMIQGTAGAAGNKASSVPTCTTSLGTAALVEPETRVLALLKAVGLESPIPLMRLMMQQSQCFQVVDRGAAMAAVTQEDRLRSSGMLRENSQTARGQLIATRYLITPNIVFSEPNAGGGSVGGALGSLVSGPVGWIAGAIGSMRVKEAQVVLFVTDAQTGVQIAAAEGSAKVRDFGGAAGLGGIGNSIVGLGGIAGYGNTNEGKLIAAALLDGYRKLVQQLQAMPPAAAPAATPPQATPPAPSPRDPQPQAATPARADPSGPEFAANAEYTPVATVNVRGGPGVNSAVLTQANPGVILTAHGERMGDWWMVVGPDYQGWVLAKNLKRMR